MFDRVLKKMRELVRTRQYVMTVHADDEMDADGLSVYDVENVILTGEIVERQTDRRTRESKCVIQGRPLEGDESIAVVAKLGATGMLVILTVHIE
jgi:hypothetical protein